MAISISELAEAREFLMALLSELGLVAHRFEVEPAAGDVWGLLVECQASDGWQVRHLTVSKKRLQDARTHLGVRRGLEEEIANSLSDCTRQA